MAAILSSKKACVSGHEAIHVSVVLQVICMCELHLTQPPL